MNERTAILSRMFLVLGLILLLPTAIIFQLIRINMIEGEDLRELWNSQTINYINIPSQRGMIYDANGSILASNSVNYRIAVDPGAPGVVHEKFVELSRILSRHTGASASSYMTRIRNASPQARYIVLERNIDVLAYEDITALGARGIILEEEYRRSYGFGSLGSHAIGYVNHALDGMNGLERSYDSILSGEDGLQQVRRDRSNRIFAYVGAPRKMPVQGHSLHTTIDTFIQAIVEEELQAGIELTRSNYGTAIVMDPRTGAVKAIANYPDYDPNAPGNSGSNSRNYALADMVEPGSTFKLVTALAAVEQGLVELDEVFETPESGEKLIHGQMMRDHNPLGTITFSEAIARSSNIAVSEVAMRLSPEVFYQYARNLGFGTPTSVDLPNEEAGRLQRPFEWSRVTLPWMSIGYEVQTTPIQILQAFAAFANGGLMMRPYVVKRISNEYGETVKINQPSPVRQIAKKETIDKLLPVFEEVVSDSGTAGWAAVEGLNIAGKTGTAQKLTDGRYQNTYRASFAGFFPIEKPKYAMFVMLDEPRTSYYGGFTAGSIFGEIATRIAGLDNEIRRHTLPETQPGQAISQHHVPALTGLDRQSAEQLLSKLNIRYRVRGEGGSILSQSPDSGSRIGAGEQVLLELGDFNDVSIGEEYARIPDLVGMNMRQAVGILQNIGLNAELIGSGTIYNQFPQAGEHMRKGRDVTVRGRIRQFNPSTPITAISN